MNYLYNGVELPDINEVWTDKETYPYAYIVDMTAAVGFVAYQLAVANNVPYWTSSDGKVLFGWRYDGTVAKQYVYSPSIPDCANNFTFVADHTVNTGMTLGLFDKERSIGVPVWCNTDILNTDGSIYLAASEPIPVGSEPEKPTTFIPDPISMTMGWLVGRRIAAQRGKYVEPDVPDVPDEPDVPDVPTGIYDDTEPLTWNSLAVTNNGAKFTYQGTPMVKISNLFGDAYDFNKYNILNIITGGMTFTATLQGKPQNIEGCIGGVYAATVGTQTMQLLAISVPEAGTYAGIDIPEKGIYVTDYGALMPTDSIDFESTTGSGEVTNCIKWDGNTDGLECVEAGLLGNLYKVSDEVPSQYTEDYTKIVFYNYTGAMVEYASGDKSWGISEENGVIAICAMYALVVLEEGATWQGFSFSPGVWFMKANTSLFCVTELHFET